MFLAIWLVGSNLGKLPRNKSLKSLMQKGAASLVSTWSTDADLVTFTEEIVSRRFEPVLRGFELANREVELGTRKYKPVTRNSLVS